MELKELFEVVVEELESEDDHEEYNGICSMFQYFHYKDTNVVTWELIMKAKNMIKRYAPNHVKDDEGYFWPLTKIGKQKRIDFINNVILPKL